MTGSCPAIATGTLARTSANPAAIETTLDYFRMVLSRLLSPRYDSPTVGQRLRTSCATGQNGCKWTSSSKTVFCERRANSSAEAASDFVTSSHGDEGGDHIGPTSAATPHLIGLAVGQAVLGARGCHRMSRIAISRDINLCSMPLGDAPAISPAHDGDPGYGPVAGRCRSPGGCERVDSLPGDPVADPTQRSITRRCARNPLAADQLGYRANYLDEDDGCDRPGTIGLVVPNWILHLRRCNPWRRVRGSEMIRWLLLVEDRRDRSSGRGCDRG